MANTATPMARSKQLLWPTPKPQAEGFEDARVLAVKFVKLYKLSSELLSPQPHYDWGLRSVKSVLRVAGNLRRAAIKDTTTTMSEEAVLMRALRDFNTPKMPNIDVPIFMRLIEDLFPKSYKTPATKDIELRTVCKDACKDLKLQCEEMFALKLEQFQGLLDVRHSVMLIGPAGCGKTSIWKALLQCWNCGYRQPREVDGTYKKPTKPIAVAKIINPKAVTSNELYGFMNLAKEWKDGVLSIIMRGMSRNQKELGYSPHQQCKWVVLDGDIDAVWIESMNTVMDANKVLTLVSNERVPLTDAMRMVFEINSLANATPATVSRAGILYINEEDIGWMAYVDSWASALTNAKQQDLLPSFFTKYVDPLLAATKKTTKTIVPVRILNQITSTCRLLDGLLTPETEDSDVIENIFAFALLWGISGPLTLESRPAFHEAFTEVLANVTIVDPKVAKNANVFDFFYDTATKEWKRWDILVNPWTVNPIGNAPGENPWGSIYVDTVGSTQLKFLLQNLVPNGHPVLLVGNAGTGKSAVVQDYLDNGADEYTRSTTINMNFYMDAYALQKQVEADIDKRSGTTFGPPPGQKRVFFIDDLNLPYVEEYGTQNSLAVLRQMMDHHSFYDKDDLGLLKQLTGVHFVAAMNPTAGSFTINERSQRQFVTLNCAMPAEKDLVAIFGQILAGQCNRRSNRLDSYDRHLWPVARSN